MYIKLTREEAKQYPERSNLSLCFIDSIQQTFYDYTPESKKIVESEEYKRMEKEIDRARDEALKRDGHFSTWSYAELIRRFNIKSQSYPNPEYIPGEQTHFAYFTSSNEQWGDDWDDVPYDCNAEIPYDGDKYGNIIVVPFLKTDDMLLPAEFTSGNCPYSVEDINHGAVAWLYDTERKLSIHAGASLEEFVKLTDKQ